jgi:hypothetical protein
MRSLDSDGSDGKLEWYEVFLAIELNITHETLFYEVVALVAHSLRLFSYLGFNKAVCLFLSSSFRSPTAI